MVVVVVVVNGVGDCGCGCGVDGSISWLNLGLGYLTTLFQCHGVPFTVRMVVNDSRVM
jgi:hypothetical protein